VSKQGKNKDLEGPVGCKSQGSRRGRGSTNRSAMRRNVRGGRVSGKNGRYVMDKQRCAFAETTHALRGPYHTRKDRNESSEPNGLIVPNDEKIQVACV